jgi:hypothetical protein
MTLKKPEIIVIRGQSVLETGVFTIQDEFNLTRRSCNSGAVITNKYWTHLVLKRLLATIP